MERERQADALPRAMIQAGVEALLRMSPWSDAGSDYEEAVIVIFNEMTRARTPENEKPI